MPDIILENDLMNLQEKWSEYCRDAKDAGKAEVIILLIAYFWGIITVVARLFIKVVLAAATGLPNIVFWVLVVFSTATPMILSGLYEAMIDRQVIRGIEKAISDYRSGCGKKEDHTQTRYQIHLLYAVLVGNLNLGRTQTTLTHIDKIPLNTHLPARTSPPQDRNTDYNVGAAWDDVEVIMREIAPEGNEGEYKMAKSKMEIRLKTMLACQASFGTAIGAPVAFFLGSFLFSVFSNHSKLGDADISMSLAFGEWWMTIPHVAIVSGCLLAENNPNTLEAIVSSIERIKPSKQRQTKSLWAPFHESVYQPVWMWERGRNKQKWIKEVQKAYLFPQRDPEGPTYAQSINYEHRETWLRRKWKGYLTFPIKTIPDVGILTGTWIVLGTLVFIAVPFVLAFITSFYTPTIGLSCRTFTFVLYFALQFLLALVWYYDFRTEVGYVPLSQKSTKQLITFGLAILFFLGSAFATMIGTFMQILGVYRNCLCSIPMGYWGSRDYHFTVSTNNREGIYYAGRIWVSTTIASICILAVFCCLGWWYQRHWRIRLNNLIEEVLSARHLEGDKEDSSKAGQLQGTNGSSLQPVETGNQRIGDQRGPGMKVKGGDEIPAQVSERLTPGSSHHRLPTQDDDAIERTETPK